MAIKKSLKGAFKGVDITKPKPSLGWLIAGTLAVIAIFAVYEMGKAGYGKTKHFVQGVLPKQAGTVDLEARLGL
jgi:hypothetical protein